VGEEVKKMGISNIFSFKGIIGIVLDISDIFIGSIPIVGDIWDFLLAGYSLLAWGPKSSIVAGIEAIIPESEAVGVGTAIGALVPSVTLAAFFAPDKPKQQRYYYE